MEIHKIVHCRVMKGLGPEWADKVVEVFFDDIEPGTCENEITYMVMAEVRRQLSGFIHFTIGDIFNA